MSRRAAPPLFTIGYEGKAVEQLLAELGQHRISRVIDVRQLPLSRRRGFSKTPLGDALGESGIEYVHVREAGNPFRHLRDDIDACLGAYAHYLDGRPDVIEQMLVTVDHRRSALLCVEGSPDHCHRSVLAARMSAVARRRIVHV